MDDCKAIQWNNNINEKCKLVRPSSDMTVVGGYVGPEVCYKKQLTFSEIGGACLIGGKAPTAA